MKHLQYDLISASMASENRHALTVMAELGITYQHATPQSIHDSWWFWNCENLPAVLPEYLTELKVDPMKCIGWGMDEPTARAIVAGERGKG